MPLLWWNMNAVAGRMNTSQKMTVSMTKDKAPAAPYLRAMDDTVAKKDEFSEGALAAGSSASADT